MFKRSQMDEAMGERLLSMRRDSDRSRPGSVIFDQSGLLTQQRTLSNDLTQLFNSFDSLSSHVSKQRDGLQLGQTWQDDRRKLTDLASKTCALLAQDIEMMAHGNPGPVAPRLIDRAVLDLGQVLRGQDDHQVLKPWSKTADIISKTLGDLVTSII